MCDNEILSRQKISADYIDQRAIDYLISADPVFVIHDGGRMELLISLKTALKAYGRWILPINIVNESLFFLFQL